MPAPIQPAAAHPQPAAQGNTQVSLKEIRDRCPNNTISWADNLGAVGRVVGGNAAGAIVSDAAATGVATHGTEFDGGVGPVGRVTPDLKSDNDFLGIADWAAPN